MGDETVARPKPLVDVGGQPILWHILKIYQAYGINDFIICVGYAGHLITEYFEHTRGDGWHVQVVDTGETTATGGRLRRARDIIGDATFCMTYGDGVASLNISSLIDFHRRQGKLVTLTAAHPRLPFGMVTFSQNAERAVGFQEKPVQRDLWVNGGFFVIEPVALDDVRDDDEPWEQGPMTRLAGRGELTAYRHEGFWQCMDAPHDRQVLEELWHSGAAPWKVW
jgi:glucose-1-phosphate cytidylyltransferase